MKILYTGATLNSDSSDSISSRYIKTIDTQGTSGPWSDGANPNKSYLELK